MMGQGSRGRRRASSGAGSRGMTMIEATVATVLVGVLFVAAMRAVAMTHLVQASAVERVRGTAVGAALLREILEKPYSAQHQAGLLESVVGGLIGAQQTRAQFDEVSDYHDYTESPPRNLDGVVIPGTAGYRRTVRVQLVNPANLSGTSSDMGAKLITVTVTLNGRTVARVTGVKARLAE